MKTPWNKDKSVGQKKAFSPRQIEMIREFLINKEKWMELALLNIGIDTMLRYSDISKLKVEDVIDWKGNIKNEINLKQQKTKTSHLICLSDRTKDSIKKWIEKSGKIESDYLFTGKTKSGKNRTDKLSRTTYSGFIKEWAEYLHLDHRDYASHTLRRSRASFMYKQGVGIETIRILLGQKSIESTKNYLGVELEDAHNISQKYLI